MLNRAVVYINAQNSLGRYREGLGKGMLTCPESRRSMGCEQLSRSRRLPPPQLCPPGMAVYAGRQETS